MYQIIKDGTVMAYVERPRYIRKHENGAFVETSEAEAQGIAINGTPYQILGRENMPGAEATVGISEVDGGIVMVGQRDSISELIQTVLEG